RGRGRGPEISDQHGTSDGPDHLRPLPNPLPRRERELFRRGLLIQRWSKDCTLLYLNYQTAQSLPPGRIFKNEHISPLSLLGRGAGGEGPKSQTSTEPLMGLITCALTLSPGGRGNCSVPVRPS